MSLEPELPTNREESDRLLRMKRKTLVLMILLAVPAGMLLPSRYVPASLGGLLLGGVLGMGYLEIQRIRIFRRDLKQRRRDV